MFGSMAVIGSDRSLVLEFDGDGRLLRFKAAADGDWSEPFEEARNILHAWHPGGGPWPRRWVVETDPLPELWTRLGIPARPGGGARVRVGTFRDGRPAGKDGRALGIAQSARYLGTMEMRSTHPVGEMVRVAVARQLASEGFLIEDGEGGAEVSGFVESFAVDESFVTFAVEVEATSGTSTPALRRRYASTLLAFKTSYDFGARAREALLDLQRQIAADGTLTRLLGAGPRQ